MQTWTAYGFLAAAVVYMAWKYVISKRVRAKKGNCRPDCKCGQ